VKGHGKMDLGKFKYEVNPEANHSTVKLSADLGMVWLQCEVKFTD